MAEAPPVNDDDIEPSPELIASAEAQIVEQSKRIDFYLTEYTVELLAEKMRNEEFFVPTYQRAFTWEEERKSRFIESLLLGLPIPFLFFWEIPESGKLEIVDGSQRLRTIEEFLFHDMKLVELEQLALLQGLRFRDLPESRQRKIKNKSIRGIVLNEHADEHARLDLFDRINTGSKAANPSEVRRGALAGPFMSLVIELAEDATFIELAPLPEKQTKERQHEELVTRFFAYGDGLDSYRDYVSDFLFDYSKKMNTKLTKTPKLAKTYRARFHDTMKFIARIFPYGFRRARNAITTPRARFEAIAIGSFAALQEKPSLATQTPSVNWINSQEFRKVTGADGANAISRLRGRIAFVKDRLLSASKP